MAIPAALIALGQQTSPPTVGKPQGQKNAQAASPSPSPEMQRLMKAFAGTWSIVEKDEPDADHPKGATVSGQEVWRVLAGGTSLLEEYRLKSDNGSSDRSAIVWWDAKLRRYEGLWCAGFNEIGCSPFEIKWNSDQIVMNGGYQDRDEQQTWYEVYTFSSPTTYTQTLDIGRPGQGLQRISTTHATRAPVLVGATIPRY